MKLIVHDSVTPPDLILKKMCDLMNFYNKKNPK